jgi:hypothetical protein
MTTIGMVWVAPQQQQQQPDDPVEVALASSGLPERAQQWLRQPPHYNYMLDPKRGAQLQYVHYTACEKAAPDICNIRPRR